MSDVVTYSSVGICREAGLGSIAELTDDLQGLHVHAPPDSRLWKCSIVIERAMQASVSVLGHSSRTPLVNVQN